LVWPDLGGGSWVDNVFYDFVKFSIKMYREIAKNHKKCTFWAFEHGKWRF
jgi:hypothetical protein